MKKKLILFCMAFLCIIYIILLSLSFIFQIYILSCILLLLCLGVCIGIYGLILYRKFMTDRIIDPKKNLKRNYKVILLGGCGKKIDVDDVLDLRGYSRNFYVDSLLVQRYYSFLAKDGIIIIKTKKSKEYATSFKISFLDYPLLHPVTLLEHGINMPKYFLFNPTVGMMFILALICNKFGVNNSKMDLDKNELLEFCRLRNINIKIEG